MMECCRIIFESDNNYQIYEGDNTKGIEDQTDELLIKEEKPTGEED